MGRLTALILVIMLGSLTLRSAWGTELMTQVTMREKSASTFYVPAEIEGYGHVELMVDTGSSYMTINEQVLDVLKRAGRAYYVRQLQGIMADGSELTVPVYFVGRIRIGDSCWLNNVEAAVFAGKSRQILGLSALRKASPFIFSVDPPSLALSQCNSPSAAETQYSQSTETLTTSAR